jgi:hypothetical protein
MGPKIEEDLSAVGTVALQDAAAAPAAIPVRSPYADLPPGRPPGGRSSDRAPARASPRRPPARRQDLRRRVIKARGARDLWSRCVGVRPWISCIRRRARRVRFTRRVRPGRSACSLPTRRVSTRTPSTASPSRSGSGCSSPTTVAGRPEPGACHPRALRHGRARQLVEARTVSASQAREGAVERLVRGHEGMKNRVKWRRVKSHRRCAPQLHRSRVLRASTRRRAAVCSAVRPSRRWGWRKSRTRSGGPGRPSGCASRGCRSRAGGIHGEP